MDRLPSHAALLARSGNDPWIRWSVAADRPLELWVHRDIALIERTGERRGFWIVPLDPTPADESDLHNEADRFRDALIALRDSDLLERVQARTLTVDAAHGPIAHQIFDLRAGGNWDWMWTTTEPPKVAGEDRLITLDDTADADEINSFSAAHNQRLWTRAGTGQVVHWLGVRDRDGALIAAGGSEREETGAPHLAGIVTHAGRRGQGLGTTISTGLTRWSLADSGVCTLGMYTDNAAARSVYEKIGFRTAHAWHSRPLATPVATS